jgi:beta-barrel assembly-enhancing protease
MAGFFRSMGRIMGGGLRKAEWLAASLTGTEEDAVTAEQRAGRDLALAFLQQCQLDPDSEAVSFLAEMHDLLTAPLQDRRRKFTIRSVLYPEPNAFAFPGGYLFVSRSLLALCQGDADSIAFVLGHEMGHVVHRHCVDRIMTSSLLAGALSRLPVGGFVGRSVIQLVTSLLNQGYSRDQELEADQFGVRLARAAGFDPQGAVRLLLRLGSMTGDPGGPLRYFSSHPPVEVRIAAINHVLRKQLS